MKTSSFPEMLAEKISGILYITESEYPLTLEEWGVIPPASLPEKIAAQHQVTENVLKTIAAPVFFRQIEQSADPNDAPIAANAAKFKALYQFLQENLSDLLVTRVETGTSIPVYITGFLSDANCIVLHTTAIES